MSFLVLDLASCGIDGVETFVDCDDISAPENYKDPLKIAAYIANERAKRIERAGLDIDLARITAIGYAHGEEPPTVMVCKTEADERASLIFVLEELGYGGSVYEDKPNIVTFGGLRFDLPLLLRRCGYLGLPVPHISLDKYRSPHLDVWNALSFNGVIAAHALTWYAKRLGWGDLVKPLSGAEESRAAVEGKWDELAASVRHDILATRRLAQFFRLMPRSSVTSEAVV